MSARVSYLPCSLRRSGNIFRSIAARPNYPHHPHHPHLTISTGLTDLMADQCVRGFQLYTGAERCYVFEGTAARLILRSRWLRRRYLVIHNAGFELGFPMQLKYG